MIAVDHDSARLMPLRGDGLTPEQRTMWQNLTAGPRAAKAIRPEGYLTGPFDALLRAPAVGDHLAGLGALLRFDSVLSARHRELTILIVAARWHADFAWNSHVGYARDEGVPEDAIEAIGAGRRPRLPEAEDQLIVEFVADLTRDGAVADDVYAATLELLGEQGTVELVVLAGYYALESLVLNTFHVPLPPGGAVPWAAGHPADKIDRESR